MRTTLTTTLLTATLALAAPTSSITKRYAEGPSWTLSNLDNFISTNPNTSPSSITFSFTDTAKGIELNTTCTHKGEDARTWGVYHHCDGFVLVGDTMPYGVSFTFDGGRVGLNRTYADSTVDKYPYVRIVTAEGEGEIKAVTSVPAHDGESGYHEVVASLEVPITRVYG